MITAAITLSPTLCVPYLLSTKNSIAVIYCFEPSSISPLGLTGPSLKFYINISLFENAATRVIFLCFIHYHIFCMTSINTNKLAKWFLSKKKRSSYTYLIAN